MRSAIIKSTLALAMLAAGIARAQTYTVREVLPVEGDGPTYAWDVNSNGVVMAVSELASARGTQIVFLDASGQFAVLQPTGSPDLPYVWAGAINGVGTFVGAEITPNFPLGTTNRAFVSSLQVLPDRFPLFAPTGGPSGATDINDAATPHSVGLTGTGQSYGQTSWAIYHAFKVKTDGQNNPITDLGTLGGPFSQAEAINDLGDVAGVSLSNDGPLHAFLALNGQPMVDLGTLGGTVSHARDLNNGRIVVGWSRTADGTGRAFRWESGAMTALGSLGGDYAEATGINSAGLIVGMALDGQGRPRAVRFDAGAAIDLNTLIPAGSGWTLRYAQSVNDAGVIVGWGRHNGRTRGFILEPGSSCYPNCDGSIAAPVLNVLDFGCFINRFAAGEAYANCDGSTSPPELNVLDFGCFINRFAIGCP